MPYETIALDVTHGIATITLARPDAYNALNLALARELFGAVLEVDEDPAVRCVVLTGSGKAFCGGGDVKDFAQDLSRIGILLKELTTYIHGVVSRLVRTPKPVITAVNGVAAGGGLSLALAGDLVVAAESARFTMAYSRIAATPDGSSTYWLPRLVGIRRAMELFYTNRVLTATEAVEWGIATRAVPDVEFHDAVRRLPAELAQGPTLAFGRGKRLLHLSTTESLETQMEHESQAIAQSGHTADFAEGVRAFAEKRRPSSADARARPAGLPAAARGRSAARRLRGSLGRAGRHRRHRPDLHQEAGPGQHGLDGRPRRRVLREEPLVDLVERREVADVAEQTQALDRVRERGARRAQDRLDVLEDLPGLGADVALPRPARWRGRARPDRPRRRDPRGGRPGSRGDRCGDPCRC